MQALSVETDAARRNARKARSSLNRPSTGKWRKKLFP